MINKNKKITKKYDETYFENPLKKRKYYFNIKKEFAKQVTEYILKHKREKIIIYDLGGNKGDDLVFFNKLINDQAEIDLIEIDPNLDFYNNFHPNSEIKYIQKDFLKISTSKFKQGNIVIISEVLEHLWDFEKEIFLTKTNQLLSKGGLVLISIPINNLKKEIFALIKFGRKNKRFFEDYSTEHHHKGVTSWFKIISLLQRKGFQIKTVKNASSMHNCLKGELSFSCLIDFILSKVPFNKLFATSSIIIAEKITEVDTKHWYNKLK